MQEDTERTILASWLMGEHLDDTKLFHPGDFVEYRVIAEAIMKGITDKFGVYQATKEPISTLDHITLGYAPNWYEMAMCSMEEEMFKRWQREHPDASKAEVVEAAQMFERPSSTLPKPSADPLREMQEEHDRRQTTPFISTGLTDLDNLLNGIRRKELTAVGARPSVGKSAFCQQIAMQVAKQGEKVLYFPLEMSTVAMTERMLMRYADISPYQLRRGISPEVRSDPKTQVAYDNIADILKDGNLLFYEMCNDLHDIKGLVKEEKPFMIVIDQLEQLKDGNMKWSGKRSRFSHMTHELQALAMKSNIAVWLACQVNRAAEGTNAPPTMANLKESGTIEEDSDNVILLHRENEDKPAIQSILLSVAKQRQGECGNVPLGFNAPKFLFRCLSNRKE